MAAVWTVPPYKAYATVAWLKSGMPYNERPASTDTPAYSKGVKYKDPRMTWEDPANP